MERALNPEPPKAYGCFREIPEDAVLHVPAGSSEVYSNANGWKNFKIIREDLAGIKNNNKTDDGEYITLYDLYGRKLLNPEKGQVIIEINNGKARKVIF